MSINIPLLRRLHEAATPAPWLNAGYEPRNGHFVKAGKHLFSLCQVYGTGSYSMAKATERGTMSDDAALIATTRNALPELIYAAEERDRLASTLRRCAAVAVCTADRRTDGEAVKAIGDAAFRSELTNVDIAVNDRIAELECDAAQAREERDRLRETLRWIQRIARNSGLINLVDIVEEALEMKEPLP